MSGNNSQSNGDTSPKIIRATTTAIMADIPPPPPPLPPLGSPPSASASAQSQISAKSPPPPIITPPLLPSFQRSPSGGGSIPGGRSISSNGGNTASMDMMMLSPDTNYNIEGSNTNTNINTEPPQQLLSPPLMVEIVEGTPAAEALKANADVRVSKLRKVGRSTRLQAGVRVLKSAARTASGQPAHGSDRRGAPEFVVPRSDHHAATTAGGGGAAVANANATSSNLAGSGSGSGGTKNPPPTIPEVDDEVELDTSESIVSISNGSKAAAAAMTVATVNIGNKATIKSPLKSALRSSPKNSSGSGSGSGRSPKVSVLKSSFKGSGSGTKSSTSGATVASDNDIELIATTTSMGGEEHPQQQQILPEPISIVKFPDQTVTSLLKSTSGGNNEEIIQEQQQQHMQSTTSIHQLDTSYKFEDLETDIRDNNSITNIDIDGGQQQQQQQQLFVQSFSSTTAPSTVVNESLLSAQHPVQQQRHNASHITHAALPAAIAAACKAGEELDRKREQQQQQQVEGGSISMEQNKNIPTLIMSPFSLFSKSTAHIKIDGMDVADNGGEEATPNVTNKSPTRPSSIRPIHRRSISVPHRVDKEHEKQMLKELRSGDHNNKRDHKRTVSHGNHQQLESTGGGGSGSGETNKSFFVPVFRRATIESLDSTTSPMKPHKMPSEISVAETERHSNLHHPDHDDDGDVADVQKTLQDEDLSDDGELGELLEPFPPSTEVTFKKHVEVNPIVVEIPGSRLQGYDDDNEEEEAKVEEDASVDAATREGKMSKAKKRMSRKSTKKSLAASAAADAEDDENDAFHFNGPKFVRKWVKKRRSEEHEKGMPQRSYVKGKVIDGKHELYTMSIAVMFGMRTSIGRTNLAMSQTAHNERRWLDNDDLMAVEKYEFPPRGSDITPPHQLNHTFKFKDYSPLAFAYLRRMFGVNEYDFLLSVCGNANYIEFQSNAKSGQFFFYSPDGKYMIKTMTNTESKFLRRILPHYFRHCSQNPNTMITKFLGMYRVKLYHLRRNVKFVVMKSVYDTDKFLNQLFDLKGSSTGRDAKPSDAVKKDNDLRRHLPSGAFILEPGLRERLRTQVEHDCEWLKAMKIMDYSMLIGMHNISHRTTKKPMTTNQPARNSRDDDDSSYNTDATLDRYLDVDDDDSYLDGATLNSKRRESSKIVAYDTSSTSDDAVKTVRVLIGADSAGDDEQSSKESKKESERIVEKAIEDMYWPFHRYYDVQGLRRMKPIDKSLIAPSTTKMDVVETQSEDEKKTLLNKVFPPKAQTPMGSGGQYELPPFERPLSYRKDGGFMMDTTSVESPIKMEVAGAPHMTEYCDGKIFYMGIIDILQQFNIRKRCEAKYRRLGGSGWEAASCVHPSVYANRFIRFFDEYTEGGTQPIPEGNESVASDSASNDRSDLSSSKAKLKTS